MSAGLLLAGAALLLHLVSVAVVMVRLSRADLRTSRIGQPRITLLRPVCGIDERERETLASSFRQDWPDYEVVFCAPSENDAALPVLRGLIAENPQVPARVLAGQQPRTGNPKLDNLYKGWLDTTSDWVCMADSNLMLPPDYLRRLADRWETDTGLVSSPPWGDQPAGLGGHLECAFLNTNQARLQLLGDSLGIGFAQGKTLFWNRAMLERSGGLGVLGLWLAEDVAATKLVRGEGLQVHLTRRPFAQPIGRRSLRAVWDRQLRWSRVRRDGFPVMFLAEITNGAVLPALLLAMAGGFAFLPVFLALWYGAEWALARRAGWPHGWRDVLVLPLRDLLLPALWLATFARRGITWRGTAMEAPARPGASEAVPASGAMAAKAVA